MRPVFSVIVPVYKVEASLPECVRSLTGQTYGDIEIILVDDGSPDGCPALCDAFARQDGRIRVIHQPNGGLSRARNAGLAAAAGEYVMFVDGDDRITTDACARLLPFAQAGFDILIGDGVCVGADIRLSHGYTRQRLSGAAYLKLALRSGSMPMEAVLYVYRRDFLLEKGLRFKAGITHEDEEFTPRAFLAARQVAESGVCFYRYILRPDSITTGTDLRKNAVDFYETCLELKARYETLEDGQLRYLLLDSLAVKYLSLFQAGRLYRYGGAYIHRRFVLENARRAKTRCKAALFALSPRLYWHINHLSKQIRRRGRK